ncbi:hypothetical protein OUZ56_017750 [Daphnia magna]|uniref:Uncharacterized protein n=1 Tax=Daphnia magna TaxID=35525 RepID=A0ABR0ATU7_9CRUS|nr:hypothetical protein OUZ56_017750 [Daphnia magna]
MTTTPVRVQVPGLNLQQEIDSSIRYTSATCLTHSVATPSRYYLIKQRFHDPSNHTDKNIQSVYYSARVSIGWIKQSLQQVSAIPRHGAH